MSKKNGRRIDSAKQAELDNRSRQLNPQHEAYWRSRGMPQPTPTQPFGNVGDDFEGFGPPPSND